MGMDTLQRWQPASTGPPVFITQLSGFSRLDRRVRRERENDLRALKMALGFVREWLGFSAEGRGLRV